MKALEELTREIRERLPRLMELSDGQRILALINDHSNDIYEGAVEIIGVGAIIKENREIEIGGYSYLIDEDYKVFGKDPMLNDVLEWLSLKSDTVDYYGFDSAGNYLWFNHALNKFSTNPTVKWNLSKPYLKDQSPELINFLHGLIKK